MKISSIIAALAVTLVLYLAVMQRDTLVRLAGGAAGAAESGQAAQGEAEGGAIPVLAVRSEAQSVESVIALRGATEAARRVDLRAETSGLIVSEAVRKGAIVQEGQVLCSLDPGSRESELQEAEAALKEAILQNTASQRLSEEGYGSESRLIASQAALEAAQTRVVRAKREIERVSIKAPFSGILESDTAELGSSLQPGSLCATVLQLNPIKLVGFVPEAEIESLGVGARVTATLATGQTLEGHVTFLSRSADPATRTFRLEARAGNDGQLVRDGTTAEIHVTKAARKAHLLPQSALTLDDSGRLGVRVVEGGAAGFAPVEMLRDTREGIWVAGLPESATVIVLGQEFVTTGARVDVTIKD